MKVDQLWQLLEQFSDVFIWHKSELGCCKIWEHTVDTQGFPPCMSYYAKQIVILGGNISQKVDQCLGVFGKDETKHIILCM
jgi:hypothetical protein